MNPIMEHYKRLVEFLGMIFGDHFEIVLQDVKSQSIIAIANGHVSGRSPGAPLTDLTLRMIAQEEWKTKDFKLNYEGRTKSNQILRSSSYFIKENGELLGMLCINIDTSKYTQLSEQILALGGITSILSSNEAETPEQHIENFSENASDIVQTIIFDMFGSNSELMLHRLTQQEKMSIVEQLKHQGVFLLKGSVTEVAQQLYCSEASIYRYLTKLSKF